MASYRFLIINADYPDFLLWFYRQQKGLAGRSYSEQIKARADSLFGAADFYSSNLRELGHEACDIHANNKIMQKAWAREHGTRLSWFSQAGNKWLYHILASQIRHYKPDIILNLAMNSISCAFLKEIKPSVRLIVGQHAASPLPETEDFGCYDLVISSFVPTVEYFRKNGIAAQLNHMAFQPSVLSRLAGKKDIFDLTFVGSLFGIHSSRIRFLEYLCDRFPQFSIYAPSVRHLPLSSSVRKRYKGCAWGSRMYQILGSSKITVNHHGDIEPYSNNMRLYEATGVGALLVTDSKKNLNQLFEPGKEVAAYKDSQECIALIDYYLKHDSEREAIAGAGQRRTLSEHTYHSRVRELLKNLQKYL